MALPLFPASSLAVSPCRDENSDEQVLLPQLPPQPQALLLSIQIYIVPAEKHLFVQGYKPHEYEGRPPTLLRGCLVVRVLKAAKIKHISLSFKGSQRTDWPEGIPPKRNAYLEVNDIISHTWPFYTVENGAPNNGADFYRPLPKNHGDEISHLNLADNTHSPDHLSPPDNNVTLFAANLIKRATSPRGHSPAPSNSGLTPNSSMADLTTVLSALSASEPAKPGYFAPGDYIYNFEQPLAASSPESVDCNFGRVIYHLEATVARMGAFKTNLTARLPVSVVRTPSDTSVEENEPIVIERDWEDQLRYEILVGGKGIVLDTYVPIALRFIPLFGKVALHRIRVSFTENCNYYCHNKSVHRAEPTRKFLLLEHKAQPNKLLLSKSGGMSTDADPDDDDQVLPRELEFQMFVPSTINKKYNFKMHPDTSFENIQCDHWIKIALRISRQDPENPGKRKHFEISIDSPVHIYSLLASHANTLLPAYKASLQPESLPEYTPHSPPPPMSPDVTAIDHSHGVAHLLLSALSGNNGPERHNNFSREARTGSPIEFHHLSSDTNNEEPIERDHRIHLEANLYSPTEQSVLENLGSPQARPLGSRVASPSAPPPMVRRPTVNPPSFDAINDNVDHTLPPVYEKEDPALLPPRTDNRRSLSILNSGVPQSDIASVLGKQLDNLTKSSLNDRKSSLESAGRNSKSSADSSRTSTSLRDPFVKKDIPPLEIPEPRPDPGNLSPSFHARRLSAVADDELDISEAKSVGSVSPGPEFRLPLLWPHRFSHSSDSLADSDCFPLEQTLPLLTLTGTSVSGDANQSTHTLADPGRRPSALWNTSMTDIMGNLSLGTISPNMDGSLFQIRNPRLKKHYQQSHEADQQEEDPKESISDVTLDGSRAKSPLTFAQKVNHNDVETLSS